ncbi:hypothetical protein [Roseiarcus fermentans]|nr:hypothetical protein [Roseiarcus fermentans]
MIAAPKTMRELFDAMSDVAPDESVETFIGRFDWSDENVQHIYHTFFGRLPESASVVASSGKLNRRAHALASLQSGEFRNNIVEMLLRAYPEKQRLIHIHIPKTAGTDFREKLVNHLPYIHYNHSRPETTPDKLLAHLAETARRAQRANEIVASGHVSLAWYVDKRLCRANDRIFTVVRDPRKSILSLINYYLRRVKEDPECKWPDTQSYASYLGVSSFDRNMDVEARRELGREMLRNKGMMIQNLPRHMLGRGNFDSAVDLIIRTNIEIVPIEMYKSWLLEQWGIDSETRANASPQLLRMEDLDEPLQRHLAALCEDDVKLHEKIMTAWGRVGGTHIFGASLLD